MRHLLPPLLLITLVLAIPIVPFALGGSSLEARMESWLDASLPTGTVAALVAALLATDIFLPVPSSVVCTFAGKALGWLPATGISWLGMMVAVAVGFGLARVFGRPLALRFSRAEDLDRIDALSQRYGPLVVVLTRPLPILAEASVLFFGTTRLSWRRFLLPAALSNLGIAMLYSALGNWVQLPVALAASIVLPILAAFAAQRIGLARL